MDDDTVELRFAVYTTEAAMAALQAVARGKIASLERLKRPSRAQRQQLALLRKAEKGIAEAWHDPMPAAPRLGT